MNKFSCTALITLALLPQPTLADGALRDFNSELESVVSSYVGREISLNGSLGYYFNDLYFKDSSGFYPVVLDAGRTARRSIEPCKVDINFTKDEECKITGNAEIIRPARNQLVDMGIGPKVALGLSIFEIELQSESPASK